MKKILLKNGIFYVLAFLLCTCGLVVLQHLTGVTLPIGWMIVGFIAWILVLAFLEHRDLILFPLLFLVLGALAFIRIVGFEVYIDTPEYVAFVVLVSLALLWILSWLMRWFGVRAAIGLLVAFGWIYAAFGSVQLPRSAIVLAAPLPVFVLMEAIHFKSPERTRNMLPMLCVSILFSLILSVVPISREPYPYKWMRRAWNGIEELWEKIETQLYYRTEKGTAFTMDFNGAPKSASTKAKEKDEQQLKVWLDFGEPCVIYLPGTTMDHFDGKSWSDRLEDKETDGLFNWQYDTAEHIYALWRRDHAAGTVSEDVFRQRRTDLTYRKMDTKTLFTTPGMLRIRVDDDRYPYHEHAGNVQFDYQQKKDCYYILYFLEENTEQLEEVIRQAEGYTYDAAKAQSWGQVSGDYQEIFMLRMVQTVQIEQALAKRMEVIRTRYLQLPEDLSPAVIALAEEITADCTTEYDTVRAIEAYLHENYEYKRNPAPPTRSEDLLEHLIDTQEGYCTWFATAACMMLRSQGIPTRYVQGYRTALKGQTRALLDEDDQHAWCEAYISGYGWITVEASPGFAASRAAWEVQQREKEREEEAVEEVQEEQETVEEESSEGHGTLLLILAGLVVLVIAAFVFLSIRLRRRRYERLTCSERSMEDLRQILRLLAKRFYIRYPYETLRTFFQKVPWEDMEIDIETVRTALKAFEDAAFSGEDLDEAGWQAGQKLLKELKRTKKKKRRF